MAKNVQGVIFLRNNNPYANRENALTGIKNKKSLVGDGQFILARYKATENNATVVKTLVGVKAGDGADGYLTIIDVEGASTDVEKLREEINAKLGEGITSANTATAQLTALSGTSADGSGVTSVWGAKAYADDLISTLDYEDAAVTGQYVSQVTQADGKIAVTRVELPTVPTITDAGKPIIAVAEDKGQIAASAGTINAEFVNIADTAEKFTATTVEGALAELDGKITSAIDALDYEDTAVPGSYVSKVDETNGVISVTRVALPSSADTAVAKKVVIAVAEDKGQIEVSRGELSSSAQTLVLTDNADGGVNFEVNIDNSTIVQDERTKKLKVASAALTQYVGDGKTIEISAADEHNNKTVSTLLTLSSVTPSSTTVKEEYALKNASGETIGSTIKIYKDSHIVSITYITDPSDAHYQNLKYVYIDADGETQTEYVDISALVLEAEFASGVTVTNHVAHGVVDPTSESFLTVGANGFKLDGVQNAINSAIEALDATGGTQTIATGKHVAVEVIEKDGLITAVTVAEDDIASATALTKEISDRTSGDTELSNRLGNGVTTANTATAQLVALSGDPATAQSGDTSVEGAKKYADAKLSEVVADLDADVSGNSTHVTVNVVEENGVITDVNVEESNIANADDLATLSGKTITAITSTNGSISASISNEAGNKTADIQTDASKIKMSGFTSDGVLSGISTDESIVNAFKEVEDVIKAEITRATGAEEVLDGRLDVVEDEYISGVSVNGIAVTPANKVAPISISGATSEATATKGEAIVVNVNQSTGAITLGIGYIDCGTYDEQENP